jgi:hypothetical protein
MLTNGLHGFIRYRRMACIHSWTGIRFSSFFPQCWSNEWNVAITIRWATLFPLRRRWAVNQSPVVPRITGSPLAPAAGDGLNLVGAVEPQRVLMWNLSADAD